MKPETPLTQAHSMALDMIDRLQDERDQLLSQLHRAQRALQPFGAGPVALILSKGDYSVMNERLVDWFGVSDFKAARAIFMYLARHLKPAVPLTKVEREAIGNILREHLAGDVESFFIDACGFKLARARKLATAARTACAKF